MSFYHAFCGIFNTLKTERHMRIHFAFANLIIVFAYFFKITKTEFALLLLTIASVFASEIINTAIEQAVDTATKEVCQTAKLAKDAAAGAVLVLAAFSVLIGICIFGNIPKIVSTLKFIFTTPKILIPCLVLGIWDIWFIIFGGKNVK